MLCLIVIFAIFYFWLTYKQASRADKEYEELLKKDMAKAEAMRDIYFYTHTNIF